MCSASWRVGSDTHTSHIYPLGFGFLSGGSAIARRFHHESAGIPLAFLEAIPVWARAVRRAWRGSSGRYRVANPAGGSWYLRPLPQGQGLVRGTTAGVAGSMAIRQASARRALGLPALR